MRRGSVESSSFPPNWGRTVEGPCRRALWSMALGMVVVLVNPLTMFGACPCPVAPVEGMEITGGAQCSAWARRGIEGAV